MLRVYRRTDKDEIQGNINETEKGGLNEVVSKEYTQIYGTSAEIGDFKFIKSYLQDHAPGFIYDGLSPGDIIELSFADSCGFYMYTEQDFKKVNFDKSAVQNETIAVIIVEPLRSAYYAEIIPNLRTLQHIVGGLIAPFYCFDDNRFVYCNDEGKIMNLTCNRFLGGDVIAGNFIVVANEDGERECSLSDKQVEKTLEQFAIPQIIDQNDIKIGFELITS